MIFQTSDAMGDQEVVSEIDECGIGKSLPAPSKYKTKKREKDIKSCLPDSSGSKSKRKNEKEKSDQGSSGKIKDDPKDYFRNKVYNIANKVLQSNKHVDEIKIKKFKVSLLKEPYIDEIWRKQKHFMDQLRNEGKYIKICENLSAGTLFS